MEGEGKVRFLRQKTNTPTCCAFHPKDCHTFAFGGSAGEIALVSALRMEVARSVDLGLHNQFRAINGIAFSPDGSKVITSLSGNGNISLVDVEKGTPLVTYDECASPSESRIPLATLPSVPNLAACPNVNARGVTILDVRMPLPLHFAFDVHEDTIHDLIFLDESWPWACKEVLISGSATGEVRVSSPLGRLIRSYNTHPPITLLHPSPDRYNSSIPSGYPSVILVSSGEGLMCWDVGKKPWKMVPQKIHSAKVTRMKYSLSGGLLYTAQGKAVHLYRRYPDHHQYVSQMFTHSAPILDLDLSPYNEYLVTAAQDSTLGLLHLGSPNHGCTQKCEFT